MARFQDPTYDPRQDSGTSGGDSIRLKPRTKLTIRRSSDVLDEEGRNGYADQS
jgi:hypothetical protein